MRIMSVKTLVALVALVALRFGVSLPLTSVAWSYDAGAVSNGGSISGTVKFAGTAPEPKAIEATKDAEVCAKTPKFEESLLVGEGNGLKNVVVSITNISSGKEFGDAMVLDQKECLYTPHITLTQVGAELEILNNDGILHNIHSYSEANPAFNQAQPKFRKKLKKKFEQPEIVRIECDAHGWMEGWIVVMEHPYYAVSDGSGAFILSDVPVGEYELKFWHETLGEAMQNVTVEAGGEASVCVEMSQS